MSRPLRIEYPDAWYHVMNRGRHAERIFTNKNDYNLFIEILKQASEAWNLRICAYCLMPNHYHLLVQTPQGNLSRCMRHINGIYTQRFNRKHKVDGQLFRGRYKSILIDADTYLLILVRYIHKNPSKASIAPFERYEWSSHKAYLSESKESNWIYKDFVFNLLTNYKEDRVQQYNRLMSEKNDATLSALFDMTKVPGMLGKTQFIDQIKRQYYPIKNDPEVPQAKKLALETSKIIAVVCKYYRIDQKTLYQAKRGQFNEPRNVALFLVRRIRFDSLKTVGEYFNIKKYSSVSSAIERLKIKMKTDLDLKSRVADLLKTLTSKSQGQT